MRWKAVGYKGYFTSDQQWLDLIRASSEFPCFVLVRTGFTVDLETQRFFRSAHRLVLGAVFADTYKGGLPFPIKDSSHPWTVLCIRRAEIVEQLGINSEVELKYFISRCMREE